MPSRASSIKGFFRRNSKVDKSSNSLSPMPEESDLKQPAPATRRPQNPPSIQNAFARSPSRSMGNTPPASSSSGNNPPPPSYSAEPPTYTPPATTEIASATDNQYAFLAHFDTVFLIDDSGSMAGSRWRETASAISAIAGVCTQHDKDGIDIRFLNKPDHPKYLHITSASRVNEIFESVSPCGGTETGTRLRSILKPYVTLLEKKGAARIEEVKPLNIIVITDGEANDDVEEPITWCAKRLEELDAPGWQVGIQFFQVGRDPEATKALDAMDNDLVEAGCARDIVDTVPWTGGSGRQGLDGQGILKVVLGAVNRRLDRKKVSLDSLRR